MALIFEWDEEKATANAIKHGVAFTEAGTIFGDEQSITIPDLKHSQAEPKFITMGMSQTERVFGGHPHGARKPFENHQRTASKPQRKKTI